jgi:hypothetical protein
MIKLCLEKSQKETQKNVDDFNINFVLKQSFIDRKKIYC